MTENKESVKLTKNDIEKLYLQGLNIRKELQYQKERQIREWAVKITEETINPILQQGLPKGKTVFKFSSSEVFPHYISGEIQVGVINTIKENFKDIKVEIIVESSYPYNFRFEFE